MIFVLIPTLFFYVVVPNVTFLTHGFVYTVNETEVAIFECTATGIPPPTISWYRNGTELREDLDPRITLSNHSEPLFVSRDGEVIYSISRSLMLANTRDDDSAIYTCLASNTVDGSYQQFELIVQGWHLLYSYMYLLCTISDDRYICTVMS